MFEYTNDKYITNTSLNETKKKILSAMTSKTKRMFFCVEFPPFSICVQYAERFLHNMLNDLCTIC